MTLNPSKASVEREKGESKVLFSQEWQKGEGLGCLKGFEPPMDQSLGPTDGAGLL